MASQRPQGDVRLYITNPDGTQTLVGEMQSATITQHYEPYPDIEQGQAVEIPTPVISLEEALAQATEVLVEEAVQTIQAAAPPAAIEEEPVQLSDMEKLLASFSEIEEGNLYSNDVNTAIDIISNAQNMQDALRKMEENRGLNFKELLFRQIDRESRELDKFMFELQKIPSLPSMDVDYI